MKYNLANMAEAQQASAYFMQLKDKKCLVEIKKVSPRRTLNQNAYLHLIIGAFGVHFGYTLDEAKHIYKEINATIYRYEKKVGYFGAARLNSQRRKWQKALRVLGISPQKQATSCPWRQIPNG